MKLIEISKDRIYKSKVNNIYYKRINNNILRSNFFDCWDFTTIVNDIEELKSNVFDMSKIQWNIKYDTKNKEIELHIRQANMVIHLDSFKAQKLLEDIKEVMKAPF
ncbi:MAG: hypothetical protein ACRDBY_11605 [Cetobacterium sp.]